MIQQHELIEKVRSYDPTLDEEKINRAYLFSMKVHEEQVRASGDPYFSHPLEVAGILSDMKLDGATIITALLHDTVEDTGATLEEIRKLFGAEIAGLVNGVTKLTQIELQSSQTKQAENLRKLVLAMSNDVRVLLVKLADRLHNMRTLHHFSSEEKRRRIARETIEIYAPLAERIGMHHIKDELEDLSFKVLNPDARQSIVTRLNFLEKEGGDIVKKIIKELKQVFKKTNLKVEVSGRVKTPYSIWRKMHRKNVAIEQLSDIMAFRILVDTLPDCYHALGIIHSRYIVIPSRFKDYISTPKPNNYQSLHTSVIGPLKHRIEVQIRTHEMHTIADYGVAAHWQYKHGKNKDLKQYHWLRSLLEILEHAAGPEEFLEHTKLEMFQDQVFCFTPAGDLISLPRGATPIDFGYAIHSAVGNHCVGAKINGRMVPLRTVLNNGDQVEITTSKSQTPSPTWERFVVTGKARAHIRRFIRTQQRTQFIELGRSILHKSFDHENLEFSEKILEPVLSKFKCQNLDDLFSFIGEGQYTSYEIIRAAYPEFRSKNPSELKPIISKAKFIPKENDASVSIRGLIPGMAVHYAKCCHPLPGDKIVGIVMTGTGVTIHTYDCENLNNYANEPERWIDVGWNSHNEQKHYLARANVVVSNQPGALANLTTIISKHNANIANLKISHRGDTFFEFIIDIEVKDADHLGNIIASLRASSLVTSVDRVKH